MRSGARGSTLHFAATVTISMTGVTSAGACAGVVHSRTLARIQTIASNIVKGKQGQRGSATVHAEGSAPSLLGLLLRVARPFAFRLGYVSVTVFNRRGFLSSSKPENNELIARSVTTRSE